MKLTHCRVHTWHASWDVATSIGDARTPGTRSSDKMERNGIAAMIETKCMVKDCLIVPIDQNEIVVLRVQYLIYGCYLYRI